MNVLVTGGAGYIGGALVEQLLRHGHAPVVYDQGALAAALEQHHIEAVIHLAGAQPDATRQDPQTPYQHTLVNGLALLDAMRQTGVGKLVFTSSAAVYGEPTVIPIKEDAPTQPINPHGEAVLAFERALHWYGEAYGLRYASLRCFNVAGATESGGDNAPDHLIPRVLSAAAGHIPHVDVYGEDYATPDGTCVRDYVHVLDVAEAHVLALAALERASCTYNVGYGNGYSVAEVVEMARQVTGRWISTEAAPRRTGDPAVLIASPDKLMLELGWQPRHSELEVILTSAWENAECGMRIAD